MSAPVPWPAGTATGVGSLPGTDAAEAARTVAGELPDLPHLPELPQRGPGSDLVGRAAALLVGLHAAYEVSRWQLAGRAGQDERRALRWLDEDLDRAEEVFAGAELVKVQVAGPWTLAASLETARGGRVLADRGACRDVAASLAEGVAAHVGEVAGRLPSATVVLQLDEPSLPAVLAGGVPTVTGYGTHRSVGEQVALDALTGVVEAATAAGAYVVAHCCAPGAAQSVLPLLRRAGVRGISLDAATLSPADDEVLGEAVEAGLGLLLGLLPARDLDPQLSDPAASLAPARSLWRRLGFPAERLPVTVAVTPACGLAGVSSEQARTTMQRCREAARRLADDPEG